ncbi:MULTISPECIES: hypothetical protein [Aquimarina]|uniref:hypothetical protein n=1 Tax=Aquimarina TaxID=290174 RepID=UPI0009441E21|nr:MULTISPECIES: hypothetical protein [Aquimarina]
MLEIVNPEKEVKQRNGTRVYLIITSIVFGILILPSIPMIMMSAMLFDSPESENSLPTIILAISLVFYPIIACISIAISWFLFVRKKYLLAIVSASLPILNIGIGIIAIIFLFALCDGNLNC